MSKYKFAPLIIPALVAACLSGCDSGSAGSATQSSPANGTGQVSSGPTSDGSGNTASTGGNTSSTGGNSSSSGLVTPTCVSSDSNKICLGIHFVSYKDSNGTPTATTAQVNTILGTMNQLWSQCNIGFQVEQYDAVDPTQYGLDYGANSQNQLDQIRQTFEQPTNELLAVTTGPWGTTVNAWTNMPGDGIYGSIMEQSIVDYGGGIIYAHEFGHYLGLDHVSDTSNLMNAVIYTNSTAITSSQCQTARDTANNYWSQMERN